MNLNSVAIRGIMPAICLGLGTVLMRASIGAGTGIPVYLAGGGTIIAVLGWTMAAANGFVGATAPGIGFAVGMGLIWSIAISCMAYGFGTLKLPVSTVGNGPQSRSFSVSSTFPKADLRRDEE